MGNDTMKGTLFFLFKEERPVIKHFTRCLSSRLRRRGSPLFAMDGDYGKRLYGEKSLSAVESSPLQLDVYARKLSESTQYKVIHKLEVDTPLTRTANNNFTSSSTAVSPVVGTIGTALMVDVETTGLKSETDKIVEVAFVPFQYETETCRIVSILPAYSSLEDPGIPIPPETTKVHGITDDIVRGKKCDDAAINALVRSADLIIAHNAFFDRPFLEKRFPIFESKVWCCSMRDAPWEDNGLKNSRGLEMLVLKHLQCFYDAHRAEMDCIAAIHLLSKPFASGRFPFHFLCEASKKESVRFFAIDAPFEAKDCLKERGYSWLAESNDFPKCWARSVEEPFAEEERVFLTKEIYGGWRNFREIRIPPSHRFKKDGALVPNFSVIGKSKNAKVSFAAKSKGTS